jgi:hypothetical protein
METVSRASESRTRWVRGLSVPLLGVVIVLLCFAISKIVSGRYEKCSPDDLVAGMRNRRAGAVVVNCSIAALEKLAVKSGPAHLVEGLAGLLLHHDPEVRQKAAQKLADLGPQAMRPLVRALKYFNPDDRFDLWSGNRYIQLPETAQWVNSDPVEMIVSLYGDKACDDLLAALADPNEFIRANAAEAMSSLHDDRIPLSLRLSLEDPSWYVRRAAAVSLLRNANGKFQWAGTEALRREPIESVAPGYKFLAHYAKDNTVLDCLLKCLKTCGSPEMACHILNTVESSSAGEAVKDWTDQHGYRIKIVQYRAGGDFTHRYYREAYVVVPKPEN